MPMNRILGVVLTVLGLLGALMIGLLLATGVMAGQATLESALSTAILAFVPIMGSVLLGTYLFGRPTPEAEPYQFMAEQRSLLDMLKREGRVSISAAAAELKVTRDEMREIVIQLVSLNVFSGYVNWEQGIIVLTESARLRSSGHCQECEKLLDFSADRVVCDYCATEYFLVL